MKQRPVVKIFFSAIFILASSLSMFAQDVKPSSSDLVRQAWDAQGKKEYETVFSVTDLAIELYSAQADQLHAGLTAMPKENEITNYQVMNDVAICIFIQGEAYMRQSKNEQAVQRFKAVISKYPFSQAWDPRGWYWSVAKVSQESIDKIEGKTAKPVEEKPKKEAIPSHVKLQSPGVGPMIDYLKYGEFQGVGTKDYKYVIKDQEGLSLAVGEGVYPNTTGIRWNSLFKEYMKSGRLEGSHWDFVQSVDLQAAFFKWATAAEPTGVRLFYIGLILEKSGLIEHAIKAYYSIIVHFPGTYGWTYWHTPWYIGQAAISKIKFLLRRHPELGLELKDAAITIINGYDNDVSNDIPVVNPGRLVKVSKGSQLMKKIKKAVNKFEVCNGCQVKKTVGEGDVRLVQCSNGDWQLLVGNHPYIIKGITYSPTKVGQSPDDGTQLNWMQEDYNKNGKIDGPYDSFVDTNGNNKQDPSEPTVGDFQLLKEMKVNTIRLYHHPLAVNKELLRDLYKTYGIRVILGDFLGKYALGSGATWFEGTDYNKEEHRKAMLKSVTDMVTEFKDEPYILFWLLGNENVYGVACNADKDPEAFFKFANEVARAIKAIDPKHPVAICSGDVLFLDRFGKFAPDIDIFGANAYRGDFGFGYLWQSVKNEANKPVFITEFGCGAYADGSTLAHAEELQKEYHRGSWEDIMANSAGAEGAGNAIGGVVFEWLDEWWKGYEPSIHDTKPLWRGPFPDGWMHEEWLGVAGQGDGSLSPFLRNLRKSYYYYQKEWR